MDLSSIIDEFNRRKAQAGQGIADTLGLQKKPANWFQQMQQGQNAVINPQQRDNINRELADMVERFTAGMVPEPIRARDRAMQTNPSAAAKPFTSEEVKGITPFVTAAAPIAYHGTPHSFDKFDASKIGTGQGAQSYGHGLYFAENPDVAKQYAEELTRFKVGDQLLNQSQMYDRLRSHPQMRDFSGSEIHNMMSDIIEAKRTGQNIFDRFKPGKEQEAYRLISDKVSNETKNMYQVNIPDQHAARMLDWDKPLSEQAGLKNLLESAGITMTDSKLKTGATAYGMLADRLGSKEAATEALSKAGIPGIKYLDQGSRNIGNPQRIAEIKQGLASAEKQGAKDLAAYWSKELEKETAQGTRNFVVFDPAILEDVTRK